MDKYDGFRRKMVEAAKRERSRRNEMKATGEKRCAPWKFYIVVGVVGLAGLIALSLYKPACTINHDIKSQVFKLQMQVIDQGKQIQSLRDRMDIVEVTYVNKYDK